MKQLRIGPLAHYPASLRDNILQLEDQHPSPSTTPPPQTLYFPPNDISPEFSYFYQASTSLRDLPPTPSPQPRPSLTGECFPPLTDAVSVEFTGRGRDSEGLWCCKPPSRWRTFLLRSGGSWLLTWYPRDPTTGGLDYHGGAGAFLSPTKSWAVFASALVRDC